MDSAGANATNCPNPKHGHCSKNVHNILMDMGQDELKSDFVGDLFPRDSGHYPEFDTKAKCIQYLQEYVPLHLAQITYVLKKIINGAYFNKYNNVNVLDLAGGPATVPLAISRILDNDPSIKRCFDITIVEKAHEFNVMHDIFRGNNHNQQVTLKSCEIDFYDKGLVDIIKKNNPSYQWIILSNALVPLLGINLDNKDRFNLRINQLFQVFKAPAFLLTLIEGGTISRAHRNYMDSICETNYALYMPEKAVAKIGPNEPIDSPWLLNCKKHGIYRTACDCCRPNVNSRYVIFKRH